MEKIKNFDEWLLSLSLATVQYYAIFNEITGEVTGIYPDHSCQNIDSKLLINDDIAENIISGLVSLHQCSVDDHDGKLKLKIRLSQDNLIKQRIHKLECSADKEVYDLKVLLDLSNSKIIFSLSENIKSKQTRYQPSKNLNFIFSAHNDPFSFFQAVSFDVDRLYQKDLEFCYSGSKEPVHVFTVKSFKKYLIEIKQ